MSDQPSNRARGRLSQDAEIGNALVDFVNRSASPYPTEVGGPRFEPIAVERQKDIMVNVARMHAQQEYDRIMALVAVLQAQADQVRRRLEITDWVHAAQYQFQVYHGQCYWLVHDSRKNIIRLVRHGPGDQRYTPPESYQYMARVRWLGDHTWVEVDQEGNPINNVT